MINGYMSEAQEGFAELKEVDEGTFVRFIQWAYNGYYDAGEFKIDEPDPTLSEEQMAGELCVEELDRTDPTMMEEPNMRDDSAWGEQPETVAHGFSWSPRNQEVTVERPHNNDGTSSRSRKALKKSFINRQPTVRQQAISICPPRTNQSSNENYTEVFLSHARVYVFAEKYDIQLLKALALDELHGTLQNFSLYPERTGDIIALLRYIYATTAESVDGVEDMRTILQQYIGFEMRTMMGDKDFGDLMIEDGGALLGDFLKVVKQRLS